MSHTQLEEIELLIRARYPIIYIVSWEEERIEESLFKIAQRRDKKLFVWSVTKGIQPYAAEERAKFRPMDASRDPIAALDQVIKFVEPAIYVFEDLHGYMQDPTIVRKLRDIAAHLKNSFKTLILLSPLLKVPCELEKDITVCDFDLPAIEELGGLLDKIIVDIKDNPKIKVDLSSEDRIKVLKSALGLTLKEAENVFAKALVKDGCLNGRDVSTILSEKQQIIKKSQILEYYSAEENFDAIGGLDLLKAWLQQRMTSFNEEARDYGLPNPRGILILGVQGVGKSLTAKALANFWNMPLLRLDMGPLLS